MTLCFHYFGKLIHLEQIGLINKTTLASGFVQQPPEYFLIDRIKPSAYQAGRAF